jgi:hypothetical protein
MQRQNQIKRTLSQPESIEAIRGLLEGGEHASRASLAQAVCRRFGFLDTRMRTQKAGCVKALRELERDGEFVLPVARHRGGTCQRPRRLEAAVEPAQDVPAQAGEVRGLKLVKVESLEHRLLWNELMAREHPQGAGPLVGAQMRYLIGSEHGWLGGFGFAAAAVQLAARDQWIGWDVATRRQHLHRVVGMNRFLIRTAVRCHNLASHVLGLVLRRIGPDFNAQYGYAPWLIESFVDTEHFAGTCYQAANWVQVGQTQGRGRQDRDHLHAKSVKAIYVYELEPELRSRLGIVKPAGPVPLGIAEGLDGEGWAQQEFGGADLGDQRLNKRLVDSASRQAQMPGHAFCSVAQGDRAAIKGYYRLIDQPDDSQASMEAILAPHRRRTVQRMKAQATVLCVMDGSDANYAGRPQCQGLGSIGTNQTGAQSMGLHLHSTLALTTAGLPLGVLGAQCAAPIEKDKNDKRPACQIPIEEKKTFAWLKALRECVALADELPGTHLLCTMDREADIFEMFDEQRKTGKVDLLVRAKHDRATCGELEPHLFDAVRASPVQSQIQINVPRQSARPKKSKQKARPGKQQRTAQVALRYRRIELRPPAQHKARPPLTLWVVHAQETSQPADAEPVEWFLLTTRQIDSASQAEECLRWYCLRWRIEDWHRVLKSGCRIEALQHQTAERLKRAIGINMVIAWRIMLMTLLGRQCPELPAEVLFSDLEIRVLEAYSKKTVSPGLPTLATPCFS